MFEDYDGDYDSDESVAQTVMRAAYFKQPWLRTVFLNGDEPFLLRTQLEGFGVRVKPVREFFMSRRCVVAIEDIRADVKVLW